MSKVVPKSQILANWRCPTEIKCCNILPKVQPEVDQFRLHISYFLQKCIKANPPKWICLYDIRKHKFFRVSKTFDTLQQHAIHPYELEWMISQVFWASNFGRYVGVIQTIGTGQIRVVSITYLKLIYLCSRGKYLQNRYIKINLCLSL